MFFLLLDLTAFRSALVDLTYQIDELDGLKYSYIRSALDLSQETSLRILDSSALVVRAEIEVFEKIAQKGWDSSGGLDDLIARAADPFSTSSSYGNGDGEIFSILPTESILASPHGALSRAGSVSGVHGASATEGKYQSLTGALSPNGDYDEFEDEDARSIFSGGFSNSGAGGDNLDLPGFAPSVSSAGWDHQSYSSAAPLQDLPPCSPEDGGTPPMSVPGSGNWDGSDGGDGSNSTLRERSIH